MKTETTSASNSEAELGAAPASTISIEAFTQLQSQFDGLVVEVASLRESLAITKGHVQRIGECPGLKLF